MLRGSRKTRWKRSAEIRDNHRPVNEGKGSRSRTGEAAGTKGIGPTVFISYRRDDGSAAMVTAPLFKALTRAFGRDHVFMDIDRIRPGLDVRPRINEYLSKCEAMIVLIGDGWAGAAGTLVA